MARLARLIASGLGTGYAPYAPGTAGSLVAALTGAGLLAWSHWALAVAAVLASGAGIWAVAQVCESRAQDPGWVVIDEIAGQWVAMLALPGPTWVNVLTALVLFRLLDITKPGLIGAIDRRHGALAVMGDDLAAGGVAALVLWAASQLAPALLDL